MERTARPDGIGNHALLHDHNNAPGEPNHQGNPKQIPRTINEAASKFLLAQPRNNADDDGRTKEQRAHPGHPPSLG